MRTMRWPLTLGIVGTVLLAMFAVCAGTMWLSPDAVWRALLGNGDVTIITIVRDLRVPRVLLSALVGVGLSMSGGALQGTLRNPLAEPYLLGVSGGAAVGGVAGQLVESGGVGEAGAGGGGGVSGSGVAGE